MNTYEVVQRWKRYGPRQRDAWLAEVVMGWTHVERRVVGDALVPYGIDPIGNTCMVPPYASENGPFLWQMVSELQRRGYLLQLSFVAKDFHRCILAHYDIPDGGTSADAWEGDVHSAVALASLLAVIRSSEPKDDPS